MQASLLARPLPLDYKGNNITSEQGARTSSRLPFAENLRKCTLLKNAHSIFGFHSTLNPSVAHFPLVSLLSFMYRSYK